MYVEYSCNNIEKAIIYVEKIYKSKNLMCLSGKISNLNKRWDIDNLEGNSTIVVSVFKSKDSEEIFTSEIMIDPLSPGWKEETVTPKHRYYLEELDSTTWFHYLHMKDPAPGKRLALLPTGSKGEFTDIHDQLELL